MAESERRIVVEVAWATSDRQELAEVVVEPGATVADVIRQSGLMTDHPEVSNAAVGIWGHIVDRDATVKNGDRIEIYRPLEMEPREARRKLAASGRTMSQGRED